MEQVNENPISFTDTMVRAILAGHKTQARRVMRKQPVVDANGVLCFEWAEFYPSGFIHTHDERGIGGQNWHHADHLAENKFKEALERTPHPKPGPYKKGQILWIQETFNSDWCDKVIYRADGGSAKAAGYAGEPKWKPSTQMARDKSRINLKVSAVRAERLHDITDADARAEGYPVKPSPDTLTAAGMASMSPKSYFFAHCIPLKNGEFKKNPWVWVIEFSRIEAAND